MKTKIIGWLYIIVSAFIVFGGIISLLNLGTTGADPLSSVIFGILGLSLGIYSFLLGSALKSHKKWSYKIGLITFTVVALGNLVAISTGQLFVALGLIFNVFCIYSINNEKSLFNVS